MDTMTSGASSGLLPAVIEATPPMVKQRLPILPPPPQARDYHKWAQTIGVLVAAAVAAVSALAIGAKFWAFTIDEAKARVELSNRVRNIETFHSYVKEREKQLQDNAWSIQKAQAAHLEETSPNPKARARIKALLQDLKPPVQIPQALMNKPAEAGGGLMRDNL